MASRYVTINTGAYKGKRAIIIRVVADDYVVRIDSKGQDLYYKKHELKFD